MLVVSTHFMQICPLRLNYGSALAAILTQQYIHNKPPHTVQHSHRYSFSFYIYIYLYSYIYRYTEYIYIYNQKEKEKKEAMVGLHQMTE